MFSDIARFTLKQFCEINFPFFKFNGATGGYFETAKELTLGSFPIVSFARNDHAKTLFAFGKNPAI